ncbi:hypothetical protein [Lactobacillus sp. B4007]|uniref:hypothetical protein n=1 Tax=Lactobacillus sp. B4007 TaxID=2818032 RepID=UPI002269A4DD|nr:hypothetical protein [Lactobacillus sp. B4007]MCX8724639.1 hypothetical protein [Lactobacillus sp. B4007]
MDKRNNKTSKDEKIKKLKSNTSKSSGLINKNNSKALNSYMAMDNKLALQAMKPYMTMDKILKQSTAMGHIMSQNRNLTPITGRMIPQIGKNWGLANKKTSKALSPYITLDKIPKQYAAIENSIFQNRETFSISNKIIPYAEKNLHYIKNLRLQATRDAVRQEYFKRTETIANSFRTAIKPFKLGTSLEYNYSQIVKATNVFQKSAEEFLGKHSENIKIAETLMKNGWVTSEFFYNDILKNNYQKSEDKVLEYIETFYTENNYQRFYKVLNLVIEEFKEQNLNEGYRLQLLKIRKVIKQDFDNFDLFMSTVFSIAEYVCCYKFGILSTNGFIQEDVIRSVRKDYADKNGRLTAIDIMSMFGVLKDWWKKIDFKRGPERTDFGRNPIEHGRYDPRRFKETDFIKLILFIFTVLMAPDRNTYKK